MKHCVGDGLAHGHINAESLIFFNDMNSGIWIMKLGEPRKDTGSTTEPGR